MFDFHIFKYLRKRDEGVSFLRLISMKIFRTSRHILFYLKNLKDLLLRNRRGTEIVLSQC